MRTKGSYHLSIEYLIEKLREAFIVLGHPVSGRDMASLKGFPSRSVYEQRFLGWKKALIAANLPITKPGPHGNSSKLCRPDRVARFKLRFTILHRDNFTCQYCGRTPQDGIKLEIDHINPYSNNGDTEPSNLITSCSECNIGKRNIVLKNFPKIKAE